MFMSEEAAGAYNKTIQAIRVLGLGGSTRPDSSSERALRVALDAAAGCGAVTELIAGRELMFPIYDTQSATRPPGVQVFLSAVRRADAVILASPGYHGTLSGMIKNALDYLEDLRADARPYLDGMPVGCVAVAYGWQATTSTLQSLRTTVHALRGWPSPMGAAINASAVVFGPSGEFADDSSLFQLQLVGRQVTEFALLRARWSQVALVTGSPA